MLPEIITEGINFLPKKTSIKLNLAVRLRYGRSQLAIPRECRVTITKWNFKTFKVKMKNHQISSLKVWFTSRHDENRTASKAIYPSHVRLLHYFVGYCLWNLKCLLFISPIWNTVTQRYLIFFKRNIVSKEFWYCNFRKEMHFFLSALYPERYLHFPHRVMQPNGRNSVVYKKCNINILFRGGS